VRTHATSWDLTEELAARPLQAALASAATFAVGAAVPILFAPARGLSFVVSIVSLICLAALGAIAAGLAARRPQKAPRALRSGAPSL